MFELAEHLHKTIAEIGDMSMTEFTAWQMFLGGVPAPVAVVDQAPAAPAATGWRLERGERSTRWVRVGGRPGGTDG